jgi:hypothetical protein
MLIGHYKAQPTDYVIRYSGGRVVAEGPGLTFFYLKHRTQIAVVPTSGVDVSFVFNEQTKTFQSVAVQGQVSYRVTAPRRLAELLNYSISPVNGTYVSDAPRRLSDRIVNVVHMETRDEIMGRTLELTMRESRAMADAAMERIQKKALLAPLGVELLGLSFLSVAPTPEVAKALEAEHREMLLRKADEAIYARRAAAVEEERKIKENQMASDVALEEQRRKLIELQGENSLKEAEAGAKATEIALNAYRGQDPRRLLAMAMSDLGRNAGKIQNLTITSEILASLLDGKNQAN